MSIKHAKISLVPDGDDESQIRPSDWNADHLVDNAPVYANNADALAAGLVAGQIYRTAVGALMVVFVP